MLRNGGKCEEKIFQKNEGGGEDCNTRMGFGALKARPTEKSYVIAM